MKLCIDYFENDVCLENGTINVIEIENRKYFYRFVQDLYKIVDEGFSDDLQFFDNNSNELNMNGKIKIFIDFFKFDFDSKKYSSEINKYVNCIISDEDKNSLVVLYNKIIKIYNKILNGIDLPLSIENEISVEDITKLLKVSLNSKPELLDNLLLVIDLENILKIDSLLVFVNLKQYLSNQEIVELYKYAIYNNVQILLVDYHSYGVTLEYEKKLIVDENLDEFVI